MAAAFAIPREVPPGKVGCVVTIRLQIRNVVMIICEKGRQSVKLDGQRNTQHSKTKSTQNSPEPRKSAKPGGPHDRSQDASFEQETFTYEKSDLTQDSRVPVLIAFPENHGNDGCQGLSCPLLPEKERLQLPLINGFSTYVEEDALPRLAGLLPEGTRLTLNNTIRYPRAPKLLTDIDAEAVGPGRVELLPNIQKVWDRGFTGKGERIVIIDSGIHPHKDLKDKVVEWVDFSHQKAPEMIDPYGHGTHVAGVAAGNGASSGGEIKGVAPDAELVGLRITTVAEAIKALQWCVEHKKELNLKVINMSLGEVARRGHKFDPWALAVKKANEAGLVCVVAAGNEGPGSGTISTPGIEPHAITVGAYDSKGTPEFEDDTLWSKSSLGPTIDGLKKPDVLAPGVSIFSTLAPGSTLDEQVFPHRGNSYMAVSGTSQGTPMIAALSTILLQANPALNSEELKEILVEASHKAPPHPSTGVPIAGGAGLVDAEKALDLALARKDAPAVGLA